MVPLGRGDHHLGRRRPDRQLSRRLERTGAPQSRCWASGSLHQLRCGRTLPSGTRSEPGPESHLLAASGPPIARTVGCVAAGDCAPSVAQHPGAVATAGGGRRRRTTIGLREGRNRTAQMSAPPLPQVVSSTFRFAGLAEIGRGVRVGIVGSGWTPDASGVLQLPSSRPVRGRGLSSPAAKLRPNPDFAVYRLGESPTAR